MERAWSSTSVPVRGHWNGGWKNGGGIHTKTKLSSGSISLLGLSVVKLAEPDRMIDCFVRVPG